ncbi:MAG: methyltransferase [Planctomycetales bacterium]
MTSSSLDSVQLRAWLADLFESLDFSRFSLTQPAPEAAAQKVTGRRILLKEKPVIQLASRVGTQEHHRNLDAGSAALEVTRLLETDFQRLNLFTREADYSVKRLSPGKFQSLRSKPSQSVAVPEESHNRGKQYLIPEGTPVPFLIEMGVMNAQGKVLAAKSHKFRQINRFLEMVDDIVPRLPKDRPLRVVDFGAGKSYLTFAVHHLLTALRGLSVHTTALDRNAQVIEHCRRTAERIGCSGLDFHAGEIRDFLPPGKSTW